MARSVGYFYDFSIQARPLYDSRPSPTAFLSDFAYHLLIGTIDADSNDALGLYWPKQPFATVNQHLKNLTLFSDFCERKYGAKSANPWRSNLTFGEQLSRFRAWDRRNEQSLLQNVGSRRAAWKDAGQTRTFALRGSLQHDKDDGVPFPEGRFDELLVSGFVRPGRESRRSVLDKIQIRDAMIALLQRGAGFRESEPFHLYVDDVWENPIKPGSALVRIHHPSESKVSVFNPITERTERVTRENYLKPLGYKPRNRLQGKDRVGWKDPLLIHDTQTGSYYMEAHWFPEFYGHVFWQLYKAYLSVRPKTAHPFLFVTERGKNNGEPYKVSQYNKKLERAVRRIGLNYGKPFGTTSHGLRHRYGHDLRFYAKLELPIRQKLLHHKNPNSTGKYGKPQLQEINRELNEATKRLGKGVHSILGEFDE